MYQVQVLADLAPEAQAAQAIVVTVVAAVMFETSVVVAEVAVVVVVVVKLCLSEVRPITNKYIKLAIAYERRRVKNIAIDDDGNEMKEVINGRMKKTLGHNEVSVLINPI